MRICAAEPVGNIGALTWEASDRERKARGEKEEECDPLTLAIGKFVFFFLWLEFWGLLAQKSMFFDCWWFVLCSVLVIMVVLAA